LALNSARERTSSSPQSYSPAPNSKGAFAMARSHQARRQTGARHSKTAFARSDLIAVIRQGAGFDATFSLHLTLLCAGVARLTL
jgi:hypothetical protein